MVNDTMITIAASAIDVNVVPAFCVEGPTVLDFELTSSSNVPNDGSTTTGLTFKLLINDVVVAQA